MQLTSHLAINYSLYLVVFGNDKPYLAVFLIASSVLDLDHLVPLLRDTKLGITEKFKPRGAGWRTRWHELYGLVVLSLVAIAVWAFNHQLGEIIALAFTAHLAVDFLTGESRPFFPYSDTRVRIFFKKNNKTRTAIEILLASALLLLLWLTNK